MKKVISAEMAFSLSRLAGSDNEYDGEDNKSTAQESSTNADKKVHLKSILKKSKRG